MVVEVLLRRRGRGLGFLRALLEFCRGWVVGDGLRVRVVVCGWWWGRDAFSPDKYVSSYLSQ